MNVGSLRLRRVEICTRVKWLNCQSQKLIDWPKRSRTGVADWRSSEISFSFAVDIFPLCSSSSVTSTALPGVRDTLRWLFKAWGRARGRVAFETSWFRRLNCRSNSSSISVLSPAFGRLRDLYVVTGGIKAVEFEVCWGNGISFEEVLYEAAAERARLVGIYEIYPLELILWVSNPSPFASHSSY